VHARPEPPERAVAAGTNGSAETVQRWRLVVRRDTHSADLAQREQLTAWEAALDSTALPLAGLDAQRPRARIAIAAPLSGGISGEAELVDLFLTERLPRWRVREALAGHLPTGYMLVDLYDVWRGEPALPGRVVASVYRATLPTASPTHLAAAAAALLDAHQLPRERRRGDSMVSHDLRPFLLDLAVEPAADGGAIVRMTLRHDSAKGVGRPDETLAALGEVLGGEPLMPALLVRERLVLADPPVPTSPAPHGAKRPPSVRSAPVGGQRPSGSGGL
jgi:radical SAM-linked protein